MSDWTIEHLRASAGGFHLGPVDLAIHATETIAVLGRSGAGKTTFLRAMAGLTRIENGRLLRGSRDVGGLPPEERASVYVPQGLGLFPHRTVRRNVGYPIEIRGQEAADARLDGLLERFGLARLADRWPTTLSSGEQQRVAIARALAAGPEILLWDEPLGALDLVARDELLGTLREARSTEAMPLLFVTHDPALALSLGDRWLVLDAGHVVYVGPPGPVLASPPDRFLARFAGFENIFGTEELAGAAAGTLRYELARRAGPGGVGLGTPEAGGGDSASGAFVATVERVEPTPDGLRVQGRCDGLALHLRVPFRSLLPPKRGERLRFALDGVRVAPIGTSPSAPIGGTAT